METNVNKEDSSTIVDIIGRIDTSTSTELEEVLLPIVEKENSVVLNFEKVEYISSVGLRLLLSAQKQMNKKKGKFLLKNTNEFVDEVLEMTGFCDIIKIEN